MIKTVETQRIKVKTSTSISRSMRMSVSTSISSLFSNQQGITSSNFSGSAESLTLSRWLRVLFQPGHFLSTANSTSTARSLSLRFSDELLRRPSEPQGRRPISTHMSQGHFCVIYVCIYRPYGMVTKWLLGCIQEIFDHGSHGDPWRRTLRKPTST